MVYLLVDCPEIFNGIKSANRLEIAIIVLLVTIRKELSLLILFLHENPERVASLELGLLRFLDFLDRLHLLVRYILQQLLGCHLVLPINSD